MFQVLITVLISPPYVLMWLIDLVTGGFVTKMMRCENLPDDWAGLQTYSEGNGFNRMFPICFAPCFQRYTPKGCFCVKRPHYLPDFCPQQQIFRIFRGMSAPEPYVFETYKPQPGFGQKSLMSKQKEIINAYRKKMSWYQTCYQKLSDFDFINRHLCNNVARVQGLSDAQKKKLSVLCTECYCNYREGRGSQKGLLGADATMTSEAERDTPMCQRLKGGAKPVDQSPMTGPGVELLKRTLLIAMLVVCVLVLFYSMIKASKQMSAKLGL